MRTSAALPRGEMTLRAQSLGLLYLAGATIGLVSLLLPHPPHANIGGLWSNVGLAYLAAGILLLSPRRLRPWMIHLSLVLGTLLIARAVLLSGESVSFYSVWFIWVSLYAFYFFERSVGVAYTSWAAFLYGLTLLHHTPSSPVARWLTTFTTLIVAGIFVDMLAQRARRDAARAVVDAERMSAVAQMAVSLSAMSEPAAARHAICAATADLVSATHVSLWERVNGRAQVTASTDAALLDDVLNTPAHPETVLVHGGSVWSGLDLRRLWQPVGVPGQVLGVLEVCWDPPAAGDGAGDTMQPLCTLVAAQANATLERIRLLGRMGDLARTDELTSLNNRRAWEERLPRELARAQRDGGPVCVALLDLDYFKDYNDTRGHQRGDELLRELASRWQTELRPGDFLARYGGEEFALLLADCPLDDALDVLERLRARVPSRQTCSAGIAHWDGEETQDALFLRADRALYDAKRRGRSRTVIARGGSPAVAAPAA